MLGPERCGATGDRPIDWDDCDAGRVEELVDGGVGSLLERAHERLGVDGRRHEQVLAGRESRPQLLDCSCMLIVPRIQERDNDVRVQRYARHSSRNRSR